jgi:hypothetical protein
MHAPAAITSSPPVTPRAMRPVAPRHIQRPVIQGTVSSAAAPAMFGTTTSLPASAAVYPRDSSR